MEMVRLFRLSALRPALPAFRYVPRSGAAVVLTMYNSISSPSARDEKILDGLLHNPCPTAGSKYRATACRRVRAQLQPSPPNPLLPVLSEPTVKLLPDPNNPQ